MHDMSYHKIPAPSAAFRPKADATLYWHLCENAFAVWYHEQFPVDRVAAVGAAITAKLESIYPRADMEVLAKYGAAEIITEDVVANSTVILSRPVLVPDSRKSLWTGGPRFTEANDYGLLPELRDRDPESYARYRAHNIQANIDAAPFQVPAETQSFFAAVKVARDLYTHLHKESRDFPTIFREARGRYPTWLEIAAEYSVIDDYLASLRSIRALALAA